MKEEILAKVAELQAEIVRLETEYKIYNEHSQEESEPIKNNIDKKKWKIEELVNPIKEELKEKEQEKDNKIAEITKEAEERIERLEKEYGIYSKHSEEESAPIKYNIDKIKWELEEKVANINKEYEAEKESILNEIEKTGIDLEEYGIQEKEPVLEEKSEEEKEEAVEEKIEQEKDEIDEVDIDNIGEKIEKETSNIINPILANSTGLNTQVENGRNVNRQPTVSSQSVKIQYNAKTDEYVVENINKKQATVISRKELSKMNMEQLADEKNIQVDDLTNLDSNIYQILLQYDKTYKTNKASEYFDMMIGIGKNKQDRQNEMKEHQIDITYNLKGLYDEHEVELDKYEDNFKKEERAEILNIANNAKNKGIATVKKGIKVTVRELIDKVAGKFTSIKLLKGEKVEQTPEIVNKQEENENAISEADKQENRDIDFKEALKAAIESKAPDKLSQEMMERNEKVQDIKEGFKERSKLYGKQFEFKNGNYVPGNKQKDDEEKSL